MPDINMQVFEEAKRNQLVTEIDIQTQVALDDYQVKLSDIANPTQSQDNVVIDKFGKFLSHWNESLDFDTWVKMSMEVAGKRLLMLRGNSSVSSASNGSDTFIQYHGAATTDYLDSLTVSPSNIIYESYLKVTSATHNNIMGLSNSANVADDGIYFQLYDNGNLRRGMNENENTTTTVSETPDVAINTYIHLKFTHDGSTIHYYIDDNEISTGSTTNFPDENLGLLLWNPNGTLTQDWSFVRKYTATEPNVVVCASKNIATALKSLGRAG